MINLHLSDYDEYERCCVCDCELNEENSRYNNLIDEYYCDDCYYETYRSELTEMDETLDEIGESLEEMVQSLQDIYNYYAYLDNPELSDNLEQFEKAINHIISGVREIY